MDRRTGPQGTPAPKRANLQVGPVLIKSVGVGLELCPPMSSSDPELPFEARIGNAFPTLVFDKS